MKSTRISKNTASEEEICSERRGFLLHLLRQKGLLYFKYKCIIFTFRDEILSFVKAGNYCKVAGMSARCSDPVPYAGCVCCWFWSCSEGFSLGFTVFLPPENPLSPNSSSTRNNREPAWKAAKAEVGSFLNIVILKVQSGYITFFSV